VTLRIRLLAALVLAALAADGILAYRSVNALIAAERTLTSSQARLNALETSLSTLKDAETGQRGYLITGDETYLQPYNEAIAGIDRGLRDLRALWPEGSAQSLDELDRLVSAKRAELEETIKLRRMASGSAAEVLVRRGLGKQQMDAIRTVVSRLRGEEHERLAAAAGQSAAARRTALATVVVAGTIATTAVLICLWLLHRDLLQGAAIAEERAILLQRERAARAAAEEASQLKDDFLAKLSHELRNPLHAVVGWLQVLRERPDDAVLRGRAMSAIERNSRSLQRMIEDLLDLARASSGKLELRRAPTTIRTLVASVVETLRPSAAVRGVTLQEASTEDPTVVTGDYDRLAQVVINVVSNAIKFTPDGGHVSVTVERTPGEVVVIVSDTGLGISPEAREQIFEPFRQAGPRLAGPEGGLGLGLSIAKQIVELHGGTIAADSDGLGRGARFTIRLPAG
jgi:signal transduction histidine kinase